MSQPDKVRLAQSEAAWLKIARHLGVENAGLTYDQLADFVIRKLGEVEHE